MKRAALLLCLAGLAGCSTDSADSLSRDYRNLNNEAIDALMMSTSEARAKFAKDKILKPYGERLKNIDKRFDDWLRNTDDKEIIRDTLSSDSVATLLAELPINRKRLENEQKRILAKVQGFPKEAFPVLNEFAAGTGLTELKTQLDTGNKFNMLVPKFDKDKPWVSQKPKNYDELQEQLTKRLKALALAP